MNGRLWKHDVLSSCCVFIGILLNIELNSTGNEDTHVITMSYTGVNVFMMLMIIVCQEILAPN